ncbi:hypothetical protein NLJ89_g386 [Agrocybe chaxingu]|uniref:UBC core domain-containing protein n=1 Tax=Agrocybe chaxingu TaxID=84603 RepID=A0A9W8N1Z2_9AGAR|nr:hypothetical protein NLJ89_g386 [Agrocybe chaxingu]
MGSISARRLAKELREIQSEGCPVGITLVDASDFSKWLFTIEVMGNSQYQGEAYTLQFRFDAQYPISSPAVQFVVTDGKEAPVHPHVYSNGHKKERPADNDRYVRTAPDNPKKTLFHYDDDTV